MEESCQRLWEQFLASGSDAAALAQGKGFTCWQFGHGVEQGDRLLAYVLSGSKRATAGSLWVYEHEQTPLPVPGDFSVVTDGSGIARCIIMTAAASVVPFEEVDEDFAFTEAEGDRSLEYWRRAHWDYFVRELSAIGRVATPDMPIVCERFDVVFPLGM